MYWYALSLLGRAEEAEDVVHDVFAAFLRRRGGAASGTPAGVLADGGKAAGVESAAEAAGDARPEEMAMSWVEVGGVPISRD